MKNIITKYNLTGCCDVDVDMIVKKWNKLFRIHQWNDEFRLVKFKQYNSPATTIKCTISKKDALEIIHRIDLSPYQEIYKSATTWK